MNPKTTKEIKVSVAIKKEFAKKLIKFSEKVNKSVFYWSVASFHKNFNKNVAKQLRFTFNSLNAYWETEAKEYAKNLSLDFANKIKKYVNLKFINENKDFNKKSLSQIEKNQLNAIYERNLNLIKSIPNDIISKYQNALLNDINNFDREALEKQFKTIGNISKRRAQLIARDQTQKAVIDYQSARAKALGFEFYMWKTSQDERVSKGKGGHRQLNNRIYRYDTPTAIVDSYGNVGHCGTRVNCRCVPISVYLNQNEKMELVKDSLSGDYYKIVKK